MKHTQKSSWLQARKWIVASVFIFFYIVSYGHHRLLHFRHLSVADGLSQSTINCILQDSKGYMWFATDDGLDKYDGYKFTVYQNDANDIHSISGNRVMSIVEDREHNFWVATAGAGISKFVTSQEHFVQYLSDKSNKNSLSNNNASSILVDKKGVIWIGTNGGGLNKFNPVTNTFTSYIHQLNVPNSLADNEITCLFEDSRGNIWIGTDNGGLDLFDQARNQFIHYQHNEEQKTSLIHNYVRRVFEDHTGKLWIGTNGGLDCLNEKKNGFIHYQHDLLNPRSIGHNVILSLNEDALGHLWIGTENGGMDVFDGKKFNHYLPDQQDPTSLSSPSVYSIYRDSHQNMWVGTFGGGINWVDSYQKKFNSYHYLPSSLSGLSHNMVNDFSQDAEGLVWVATDGGGINCFDPKKRTFTHYVQNPKNSNSILGNFMTSVLVDDFNNVWTGAWEGGVTKISADRKKFTRYQYTPNQPANAPFHSNYPYSIKKDRKGMIWFGEYGGGLTQYDPKKNSFTSYRHNATDSNSLSSDYIQVVLPDQQGTIWIGTLGDGLTRFTPETNKFIRYYHDDKDKESLTSNDVYSLFEDRKGIIWIGSSGGLNKFDPHTNSFSRYSIQNGLPSNAVMDIQEDTRGNLWISTKKGLCKFNPVTKVLRVYTQEDGLQSNEFNRASLHSATGELYFGGTNGFTVFYPDSIQENPVIPPVYLTDFQIFNKSVQVGGVDSPLQKIIGESTSVTLPHDASVISFEFVALNFTIPQKNKYAYMLEGFDKVWNYVGNNRHVTYTNLDPGTYTFRVKASNNDGIWNEKGTSVQLIIIPPWWKTFWFRIGLIGCIILLVSIWYTVKTNTIRKQNRILENRVLERTHKIEQQKEELAEQRDILSQQKNTIEEKNALLEKSHLLLEQLVEERTEELINKNRRLEQFAFITSHNFRSPVATLLGLCSVFNTEDPADPFNTVIMEKTGEVIHKLDEMIQDLSILLDHQKDAESLYEWVELKSILYDTKILLAEEIQKSGVRIHENLTMSRAYLVPAYIHNIFLNLIGNAIKYRQEDVPLEIHVSSYEDDTTIILIFQDNGSGIDLTTKKNQIFSPFKRFHTHIPGKGIGLYMIKTQVESMRGSIQVESEVNKGTTFTIQLQKKAGMPKETTSVSEQA
ncbi:two-component regulator propeller domain-containing protein [Cytophagaceae bacterium YF14B1]|uniref:histidine kinase n=1 Tax=Xanthocytophaga flava TaxID=3048013 RepID=A0AAE3QQJ6_9BACT|nr:two-component regulator propeller domain-containing protein [Xanthocytophaga flavus]MDJ1481655.1 two-component regulator propeller domain-containing protein [Xanthocytophaga flavus]